MQKMRRLGKFCCGPDRNFNVVVDCLIRFLLTFFRLSFSDVLDLPWPLLQNKPLEMTGFRFSEVWSCWQIIFSISYRDILKCKEFYWRGSLL